MRPFWIGLVALLAAGCFQSSKPPVASSPPKSPAPRDTAVNPVNIKRVARDLPAGYEVTTGIPSAASPRVIWRLESGGTANPPQCAILADPGDGRDQSAEGVSGSGAGGIVDAIVVSVPGSASDHDVAVDCGQWTLKAGRTSVSVRLIDAPHIDGVETVGMVADIRTSVESGTEIDSRAYTFTAYLGDYYAFTTLTTDPGSALPALPPQFAADLLVKTVSTLRS
jgi:FlaG/FlaF family flagellin (archaellin)